MSNQAILLIFVGFVVAERVAELVIANKNEKWILAQGGVEIASTFSQMIVAFHILWFAAFLLDVIFSGAQMVVALEFAFGALVVLQAGRYWCIHALGKYWNTKVLVLPNAELARRGPYKFLKHPNYVIVVIEIFLYPTLFGCLWTATVGTLLNGVLLAKRISQEEAALREMTNYRQVYG